MSGVASDAGDRPVIGGTNITTKSNALTAGQRTSKVRRNGHGAIGQYQRERDDFYATPRPMTEALLDAEPITTPAWECACGDGAISEALKARGVDVVSTDLVGRGYGESRIDFLMEHRLRAPAIISNPPFKLWVEFARHALSLSADKVILLGRLGILEGKERGRLYRQHPPARIWVHSSRTKWEFKDFGESTGMIAFCWIVWERGNTDCRIGWLP